MKVSAICTPHVVTIPPGGSVLQAAQLMREHHVGDVIVVELTPRGQIPLGIITDRDIVIGIVAQGITDLGNVRASDAMARDLMTIGADDDVFRAMEKMSRRSLRRLPVVNAIGVLVGIVTYDDVLRGMAHRMADLTRTVTAQPAAEAGRRGSGG